MRMISHSKGRRGFTLLELIIVIAVLAILAVAVILVINPAETLRRSRDTTRLTDLNTVKAAIALYITDVANPVLDADAGVCGIDLWTTADAPLGLMGGFGAGNTRELTSRAIDGTGWLPVPFNVITGGSPIPVLPLDPTNTASHSTTPAGPAADSTFAVPNANALLYLYACDSTTLTFELNANMESERFSELGPGDRESTDGGDLTSGEEDVYETGTDPDFDLIVEWGLP